MNRSIVLLAETGVRQVCMFVLATGVNESYHVVQRLLQLIDTRAGVVLQFRKDALGARHEDELVFQR